MMIADLKRGGPEGYHPDMDGQSHEAMYRRFVHFAVVATLFAAGCVAALAVGGVHQAWISAIIGIVIVHIAALIALFSPSLSWKPGALALALLLAMLALY